MGILPDWLIKRDIKIVPFEDSAHRPGVISYGVSSYGYDVRVGRNFKVFTNVYSSVVDPKKFDPRSFVDFEGDFCLIPPNSFALAETVEYFEIPRNVLATCLGKCLTGDTRVVDAQTGDYLPLRDFVSERRQATLALDGWKLREAEVGDYVYSGIEPVYELTTKAGLTIKATARHPFRTWEGWQPLTALQPGDRLAVARSCPVFGCTPLPEHEATLLGLMIADGQCRTPGSSPRYTTADTRLVEVLTEAAEQFGCYVSPVGYCGYNIVNRVGRGGLVTQNRMYAWLHSLGCAVKSVDKAVPRVIFRAPRASVAAFLRALFSGDGSAYSSRSRKGTLGVCVEYASSSERLIRDVRHLLLRFGIFSLLRSRMSASGRRAYRIQITDVKMLHRFRDEIGFVLGCQKQRTFERLLGEISEQVKHRTNFDTLPSSAWSLIEEARTTNRRSLLSLGLHPAKNHSVAYETLRAVAVATSDATLAQLAESDVVWDTVQTITPAGVEAVYDISVPGCQNFLANDITVHNSTYARCGIIVNVTPLEPEWRGKITIEISNTTPLPAKIYANEGIAQILFFRAEEVCQVSYGDKKGKYQDQKGLTLPFVVGDEPPTTS